MSELHSFRLRSRRISGAIHTKVPPSGMVLCVRTRDRPKSSIRGRTPRPAWASTRMLLPLMSPCTMCGARVCMYIRPRQTPIMILHRESVSGLLSKVSSASASGMNLSSRSPLTSSITTENQPSAGSTIAPWTVTMLGCRNRLRTRISLHRSAMPPLEESSNFMKGSFTATLMPQKKPFTTTPKPPRPRTHSRTSSTSALPKRQCSWSPIFATSASCVRTSTPCW
mmetsp:Transcript_40988/g.118444  ORF Transcript_40988/g.118444 Transcript_40988/m.118444 type:complete len:225 (-) Transcript_40988:22-696(-)